MENPPWKIEWSNALSMANPEIDAEHQHFIELINDLNGEIMNPQRDKAVIVRLLRHILEESIAHFEHEERFFVENAYPAAKKHAQIHSKIAKKIKIALKDFLDTKPSMVWIETGLRIKVLLVNHLLNEDTRYINYLRTE
ncbi:MAG: hemerythrin domain-containing protein [Mariprofundaceae bacterium]